MKDWLDAPANYPQQLEADYWCSQCRERYSCVLRFDNETGVYYGNDACLFCGHGGIPVDERDSAK